MEQNETGCQAPPDAPILCVNNCGFFGTATTMNMCSKCHKDLMLKQEHAKLAASSIESIVNGSSSVGAKESDVAAAVDVWPGSSGTGVLSTPSSRVSVVGEKSEKNNVGSNRRHEESYYETQSTRNTNLNTGGNRAERYSNALIIVGRSFVEEVDIFPVPPNFKMPPCESYDGTEDPMEHLARFTSGMSLHLVPPKSCVEHFP
ncbi:hypothetical protein RJ639_004320 [Escallonia herrerae]|uniref:A20-type domain-containing protein n=1 Tax=Escallonia herrerae TaxID=1293975 RepID=A0AA89AZ67_9ASTE|nr:hypothetical protein RJ639_004320 [Escallonia herrerae]